MTANPPRPQSNWFWPGLVVAFLLFSVGSQIVLVMRAQSDGGVQIEDDYYTRAVAWDQQQAHIDAAQSFAWTFDTQDSQWISLNLTDLQGNPTEALDGQLSIHRPQQSKAVQRHKLEAIAGKPGHYRVPAPAWTPGLWELRIQATHNDQRMTKILRVDHPQGT